MACEFGEGNIALNSWGILSVPQQIHCQYFFILLMGKEGENRWSLFERNVPFQNWKLEHLEKPEVMEVLFVQTIFIPFQSGWVKEVASAEIPTVGD